jgi:hypothetical protein
MKLMEHHARIARSLAGMDGDPEQIARKNAAIISENNHKYRLDQPVFFEQYVRATTMAVRAARSGEIVETPDYVVPDPICRNCNLLDCEMQRMLDRWRLLVPYEEWEEFGVSRI